MLQLREVRTFYMVMYKSYTGGVTHSSCLLCTVKSTSRSSATQIKMSFFATRPSQAIVISPLVLPYTLRFLLYIPGPVFRKRNPKMC